MLTVKAFVRDEITRTEIEFIHLATSFTADHAQNLTVIHFSDENDRQWEYPIEDGVRLYVENPSGKTVARYKKWKQVGEDEQGRPVMEEGYGE